MAGAKGGNCANSKDWLLKMVHVALFLRIGPESFMFMHKTPCDNAVAALGGVWAAKSGFSKPLFREDILDNLACRRFKVRERGRERERPEDIVLPKGPTDCRESLTIILSPREKGRNH